MFGFITNSLSSRDQFTKETPLPSSISRKQAVGLLHNHAEIIRLNPLVVDFHPTSKPAEAPEDESHWTWYEITDKITYLPGVAQNVTYRGAFLDTPDGLHTHVYAPAGLEIRERWSVRDGSEASTSAGCGAADNPFQDNTGLVLCEDIDMTCNILLMAFVKKQLEGSHGVLTKRLLEVRDQADC
ncbi:hypothetical protein B9Z65_6420 [Elsinoe australis]|uniref:DUF7053 domain-containing protein n=1 Tax=Elsinoe australis TaxID=40998 RepID=A0A2P8A8K2_9PEZI|nr:hypothetical protein B9Z65_6420 [Elsinoe australis]